MTIGEHIRNKRLSLGLLPKDVAQLINVSTDTITYLETGKYQPRVEHMAKLIAFLGYNPFAIDSSHPGGNIKWYRYEQGLSQEKFGKLIGVMLQQLHY